jgi:hypothetical protein
MDAKLTSFDMLYVQRAEALSPAYGWERHVCVAQLQ